MSSSDSSFSAPVVSHPYLKQGNCRSLAAGKLTLLLLLLLGLLGGGGGGSSRTTGRRSSGSTTAGADGGEEVLHVLALKSLQCKTVPVSHPEAHSAKRNPISI